VHPTLTSLDLRATDKAHLTSVVAEMMKENTTLLAIELCEHQRDEKIYTEAILPYLEANLYRPRVLAVKKTKQRPFREKVLGRALYCVRRSNPNLVWMFLSQNVDAVVRLEEEEEEEEEEESNSEMPAVVEAVAGSKRKR
jgi:hypothetical protein